MSWHQALGFGPEKYRFHDHEKLAHYANAATDIEFRFPFGFKEVEGIHSRTDFDLKRHQEFSGKKIQYFDPELNESYVPYVIETSIGVDRMFLQILSAAYTEEEIEKEINELASEYNMEVQQVRSLLSADMLKHDIAMKKAVEAITGTAKVK